jgi:acetyl esterase/lipase
MPGFRARLIDRSIRRLHVFGADGDDAVATRRRFGRVSPPLMPGSGVKVVPVERGSPRGEWVVPKKADDAVLLYLHGGGWFMGSPQTHRALVGSLAKEAGVRALSLDYRLAPEHPYPAAIDDGVAAYEWLLANHLDPGRLVVGGDSAGGNLALALLVRLRDAGRPLPAGAVLLSPATDLTLAGASHRTRKTVDPYFADADIEPMVTRYVAGADRLDPCVSPLHADLRGLPPMLVHVGDHEILLDDAVGLCERAGTAGVEARLVVWPGMMHVFHVFAPFLPEARRANREIGEFIRAQVDAPAGHREGGAKPPA